jgi:hypothetical protein
MKNRCKHCKKLAQNEKKLIKISEMRKAEWNSNDECRNQEKGTRVYLMKM